MDSCLSFLKALAQNETQPASSRIWTCFFELISCTDNHYTTYISKYFYTVLYQLVYFLSSYKNFKCQKNYSSSSWCSTNLLANWKEVIVSYLTMTFSGISHHSTIKVIRDNLFLSYKKKMLRISRLSIFFSFSMQGFLLFSFCVAFHKQSWLIFVNKE